MSRLESAEQSRQLETFAIWKCIETWEARWVDLIGLPVSTKQFAETSRWISEDPQRFLTISRRFPGDFQAVFKWFFHILIMSLIAFCSTSSVEKFQQVWSMAFERRLDWTPLPRSSLSLSDRHPQNKRVSNEFPRTRAPPYFHLPMKGPRFRWVSL